MSILFKTVLQGHTSFHYTMNSSIVREFESQWVFHTYGFVPQLNKVNVWISLYSVPWITQFMYSDFSKLHCSRSFNVSLGGLVCLGCVLWHINRYTLFPVYTYISNMIFKHIFNNIFKRAWAHFCTLLNGFKYSYLTWIILSFVYTQ